MAKRSYHHGNLRSALKQAALDLVAKHGPRGFTLKEAATLAGVSVAAPYRHFDDREDLIAALAADGYGLLDAFLCDAAVGHAPSRAMVESLGRAYVRFASENPALYRVMFGAGLEKARYPALQEVAHRAFERLVAAVVGAQATGSLARHDEPVELAIGCWALAHGLATLHVDGALGELAKKSAAVATVYGDATTIAPFEETVARAVRRFLEMSSGSSAKRPRAGRRPAR